MPTYHLPSYTPCKQVFTELGRDFVALIAHCRRECIIKFDESPPVGATASLRFQSLVSSLSLVGDAVVGNAIKSTDGATA